MPSISGNNRYTIIAGQIYSRGVGNPSYYNNNTFFLPRVMQNYQMVKQIARFETRHNLIPK